MIVYPGDGSWQRIIDDGLCPRCEVALDEKGRCNSCSWLWKPRPVEENEEDEA